MPNAKQKTAGWPARRLIRRESGSAVGVRGYALVLAVLVLAVPVLTVTGGAAPSAAAAPRPPYTTTVSQTTALTDGTPLTVSVASPDPLNDPVGWVYVTLCKPGVTYSSYAQVATRGNCGYSPGVSGKESGNGSATRSTAGRADGSGADVQFIAGVGQAFLFGTDTLTCDADNPCVLTVSVFTSAGAFTAGDAAQVTSLTLTYLPAGAIAGCSGIASDELSTAGSDRFTASYVNWSRGACTTKAAGGGQAPTSLTYLSEGDAVSAFASGTDDLAYTAAGYGTPGFAQPAGRAYVAVPLAINAVVVASSGGQTVPGYTAPGEPQQSTNVPYATIDLSAGQAATLFGNDYLNPAQAELMDRQNPAFVRPDNTKRPPPLSDYYLSHYIGVGGVINPKAVAGTDATTVFASTYFTQLAQMEWNDGPYPTSPPPPSTPAPPYAPRGVVSSFPGDPGSPPTDLFDSGSLQTYSHRSDLEKVVLPAIGVGPSPLWVLTDRATATQVGLTVSSLGTSKVGFVAPTTATMQAAVQTMAVQPDGTLSPEPLSAVAANAYPMTFVEYALAPTAPLLDPATCAPRAASQQLMVQWLRYLTGPGQAELGPGTEPLNGSLEEVAGEAIAKIGTGAQTLPCGTPSVAGPSVPAVPGSTIPAATAKTPAATPTPTPLSIGSYPAGSGSPTGGLGFTGVSAGSPTPSATGRSGAPGGAPELAITPRLSATEIPRFGGRSSTGWILPASALLLLGALGGGMALASSGRLSSTALLGVGRRLRSPRAPVSRPGRPFGWFRGRGNP